MAEENWIKNFITQAEDGKFIAWDETQANELGRFTTREEAVTACWARAQQLVEEGYYE